MKFEKIPTIAVLCLLPVLIGLGLWQLNRAEQKRTFIIMQKQGMLAPPTELTPAMPEDPIALRYKAVTAIGRYDVEHQLLVDNQVRDGKVGYFVLTPFILESSSKAVLVNRGWIQADRDLKILPDIKIGQNQSQISGRINLFPSVGIKLPGADQPTEGWPTVVQVVDSAIVSKKLGYGLFPFMIELDKRLPEGYRREWLDITVMPPEQHVAYAMQWFGLAVLLAMLFVWYSRVK